MNEATYHIRKSLTTPVYEKLLWMVVWADYWVSNYWRKEHFFSAVHNAIMLLSFGFIILIEKKTWIKILHGMFYWQVSLIQVQQQQNYYNSWLKCLAHVRFLILFSDFIRCLPRLKINLEPAIIVWNVQVDISYLKEILFLHRNQDNVGMCSSFVKFAVGACLIISVKPKVSWHVTCNTLVSAYISIQFWIILS